MKALVIYTVLIYVTVELSLIAADSIIINAIN
jgi:hypothetical protein